MAKSPPKGKTRLDLLMVQKGLAHSREKAKAMIMAGEVEVNGKRSDKPGNAVPSSSDITIKSIYPPYVSRGGLKLEAALDHFIIDVKGLTILDIGASTGGFTECLLKRGAGKVIAVDVGYGQFHYKLRSDPRVMLLEKTNARLLQPGDIKECIHGAVIDVSFISVKLVIPPISRLLIDNSFIIALIKPQFEAGRHEVGKGGVIRDPLVHQAVLENIIFFSENQGWKVRSHIPSPILGAKGNKEFLVYMKRHNKFITPCAL